MTDITIKFNNQRTVEPGREKYLGIHRLRHIICYLITRNRWIVQLINKFWFTGSVSILFYLSCTAWLPKSRSF